MMRALYIALSIFVLIVLGCAGGRFQPAKVASERKLDYPLAAQVERIEGDVVVGVFVNEKGNAEQVRILESSGHAVLDTAAYKFVNTLNFEPAMVDDKEISSWTKLVLKYKLTEVAFEKQKWTEDVFYFHSVVENSEDPQKRIEYQRKLYVRFLGLTNYAKHYRTIDINYTVKDVLTKESRVRWKDVMDVVPAPFVVFDDFLRRYPDSPVRENIREELIRLLIDAEGDIRVKALKSRKLAQKSPELIQQIESRLDELQQAEYRDLNL